MLRQLGVDRPLISLHEHNETQRAEELLARLAQGARIALVSDAGMPLISDPGYTLVRAAIDAGIAVHVVPGTLGRARGAGGQRPAGRPFLLRGISARPQRGTARAPAGTRARKPHPGFL